MEIGRPTIVSCVIDLRFEVKNLLLGVNASIYKLKITSKTIVIRTDKINIPTRVTEFSIPKFHCVTAMSTLLLPNLDT